MNFNFGEVLARAWQITWKHKNLWLAGILVTLLGFLSGLISMSVNPAFSSMSNPEEINRQLPLVLLVNGLVILLSLLSIPLYVIAMAIPSLATLRVETGSETVRFGELFKGVLPYFWRMLGIVALLWVGMFLVFMVLMGCIALVGVVTMGIGMLCLFPIFILFIPIFIFVYAMMEQGVSAVLVDNLGFSAALQRAWQLVRNNLGVMALMSLIIYLGATIVSMVISVPMLVPMFGFMSDMMRSASPEPDLRVVQEFTRSLMWWSLAFSPIYAILQGIVLTFMQSAWTLTYMRLTQPRDNAPVIFEANA